MNCVNCPLVSAERARELEGPEAETYVLKTRITELMHQLQVARQQLRSLGVDPDLPFEPSPQPSRDSTLIRKQPHE